MLALKNATAIKTARTRVCSGILNSVGDILVRLCGLAIAIDILDSNS